MMKYCKKLETDKVIFAPAERSEIRRYMDWLNDFEVGFFMGLQGNLYTEEEASNRIEELIYDGFLFVIIDKETKNPIGLCGLRDIDWSNKTAEIYINIGNKSFWNKGFGVEALKLLLNYAFYIQNLNNIIFKVVEENRRGVHVAEKLGFSLIGKRRQVIQIAGKNLDGCYYEMLAEEFKFNYIQGLVDKYLSADKNLNKISLL